MSVSVLVCFEHLEEQTKLRDGAMLAQQNRMLLSLAQIMAQFTNHLKVEVRISAQSSFQRGRRYFVAILPG